MFSKNYSFEPRVGKAQKIFCICYLLMALTGAVLAVYAKSQNQEPYLQYIMSGLFLIMAAKSFYIARRVDRLLREGTPATATLIDVTPVRGITVIRANIDVPDFGSITIEHRLTGMKVAEKLKSWCDKNGNEVKALILGINSKHPRGMLLMRTYHGRLDESSLRPDSSQDEDPANNRQAQPDNKG